MVEQVKCSWTKSGESAGYRSRWMVGMDFFFIWNHHQEIEFRMQSQHSVWKCNSWIVRGGDRLALVISNFTTCVALGRIAKKVSWSPKTTNDENRWLAFLKAGPYEEYETHWALPERVKHMKNEKWPALSTNSGSHSAAFAQLVLSLARELRGAGGVKL